jgi:Na+/melibiose symporter-like transporter
MDTAGAVFGLALAAAVIYLTQQGALGLRRETYQILVLLAAAPGFIAVYLVQFHVREVDIKSDVNGAPAEAKNSNTRVNQTIEEKGIEWRFWVFLSIMVLFTLGNSSDAFLLLRAQNLGLSAFQVAAILVLFNIVYTVVSYPAGNLSDSFGRRRIIIAGWMAYALIYLGFALADTGWQAGLLFSLYGVYYGAVEGVARAFVADLVPSVRLGTAFGLFHAAVGFAALPSSLVAGGLWQTINPSAPFFFGAILAVLAMIGLATLVDERREALEVRP